MDSSSSGLNIELVLCILRRHLWLAITLFSIVLTATISVIVFLPNVYRAESFILVEGQQISKDYVRSTVTSGIENRLHTISQEILSRSRLQRLIREFRLYEYLRKRMPSEEVIGAMRRDIGIEIKSAGTGNRNTVGLEVSYRGADPRKVMMVTNTLASFYIEENLKIRERQALGTSNFLRAELQQVKNRLDEQEERIAVYKGKHLGELPGQLEANLKTVDRLQAQMKLVSDHLVRAEDRRDSLVRQIEQINGDGSSLLKDRPAPDSLATQIDDLNHKLTVLKTRLSDKHPDVIRLKREIAALEEQLESRDKEPQANGSSPTSIPKPYKVRLEAEVTELDTVIKLRTADLRKTQGTIALYQKRIENNPKREQELLLITRDYDSTRQLYNSLQKRQEEANLASSMEQRQKAERFHILDPAIHPKMPVSPNRIRLFLLGLFLSFGLAGAGVFLREMTDTSFHRAEDLQAFTKTPILVAIPRIVTRADWWRNRLRQCLGGALLALLLLMVVGAIYRVTAGNEQLVKRFTNRTGDLQLRK